MDASNPASARTPAKAQRVLVLQGGGALGSYQAGAYQALCHADFEPEWVAGISIGAINAAIIAGNPPEKRVARLKEFWEMVSSPVSWNPLTSGDHARSYFNETNAALIATFGVPGFFTPRFPPAPLWPQGSPQSQSYYDTAPLRATLERLVDFDRINAGVTRLTVSAVNVENGNFEAFDNQHGRWRRRIRAGWSLAWASGIRSKRRAPGTGSAARWRGSSMAATSSIAPRGATTSRCCSSTACPGWDASS